MLNHIWLGLVLTAVVLAGFNDSMKAVSEAAFNSAKTAVITIALPLIGITALWLGVMRLAEKSGMILALSGFLRPLLRRLFPDVPADHPAMGSMLMNIAANMIGLTNAATPLGLRAMNDLEKLNRHPGTATNAMCTFLAINTSSVQLLPTTAIGIMAAAGAKNPTAIVATSLIGSFCSAAFGILAVKTLERLPVFRLPQEPAVSPILAAPPAADSTTEAAESSAPRGHRPAWSILLIALFLGLFAFLFLQTLGKPGSASGGGGLFVRACDAASLLAVPFFLSFFPLYAALRGVRVYEEFVEGAKEGFQVAVRIIPFLVAMLVAVGMFRAAGGIDLLSKALRPLLDLIRFPSELLPLALTRPLSGSATIGLFADLVKTYGPDAFLTRMGGTILGSTETTLYVLAVYFGAVAIKRARHAVAAGLLADLGGVIASVIVCRLVFTAP